MDNPLEKIEQALQNKTETCITATGLHTFPRQFYQPFKMSGIGFIVCKKGNFSFTIQDKIYQTEADETVFLPANSTFKVLKHSEDLEYYLMLYKVEPIRDILGITVTSMQIYYTIYPHYHIVFRSGREDDLIRYIYLIDSSLQATPNSFNNNEHRLLLLSLTYQLCSIFQKIIEGLQPTGTRPLATFLKLIQLINEHYKSERGVEFYANKLCTTAKYLSKVAKTACNHTAQELVFMAVIREAKNLLNTTDMTVLEISEVLHFSTSSNFCAFFKKEEGISPQQYRIQQKTPLKKKKANAYNKAEILP